MEERLVNGTMFGVQFLREHTLLTRLMAVEPENILPSLTVEAGAISTGWRARVTPIEAAPGALDLNWVIDRVELEIWWMDGPTRRSFSLEGYRRSLLPQGQGI